MLSGRCGSAARWAMELQVRIGDFFDAPDFVEIRMVQLTSDIEVIGRSGVDFLARLLELPARERQVRTLAVADARGLDVDVYSKLLPGKDLSDRTKSVMDAFVGLGAMPVHAAANYHSIPPIGFGEHAAFSGTPQVIYANSVQGGRSNFEAGPAGIAAMFTGRVPRYGLHLDGNRVGSRRFMIDFQPQDPTEWGLLGALMGQRTGSYWAVPVIEGVSSRPSPLDLSHLGVALASFGSVGLFHIVGFTPEAPDLAGAFDGRPPDAEILRKHDLDEFAAQWHCVGEKLDIVVFGAPQLSFQELQRLAQLLDGRRIHRETILLAFTSHELKQVCGNTGIARIIEEAGGQVVHGPCFFQMFAREVAEKNGLRNLMTQSAKMANLTAGFGFRPVPAPLERCVESAIAGRVL